MSSTKAQGSLEYLLLIGGAVVVGSIVIVLMLGTAGSGTNATKSNMNTAQERLLATGYAGGLIANPSFEQGGPYNGNNTNASWTIALSTNGSTYYGATATKSYDGSQSYQITSAYNNSNSGCNTYLYQDLPVSQNTNYVVSGWVNTQAENMASGIFVSDQPCFNGSNWWNNGSPYNDSGMGYTTVSDGLNWTQVTRKVYSGTCQVLRFGFTVNADSVGKCTSAGANSGTSYFDGLVVQEETS